MAVSDRIKAMAHEEAMKDDISKSGKGPEPYEPKDALSGSDKMAQGRDGSMQDAMSEAIYAKHRIEESHNTDNPYTMEGSVSDRNAAYDKVIGGMQRGLVDGNMAQAFSGDKDFIDRVNQVADLNDKAKEGTADTEDLRKLAVFECNSKTDDMPESGPNAQLGDVGNVRDFMNQMRQGTEQRSADMRSMIEDSLDKSQEAVHAAEDSGNARTVAEAESNLDYAYAMKAQGFAHGIYDKSATIEAARDGDFVDYLKERYDLSKSDAVNAGNMFKDSPVDGVDLHGAHSNLEPVSDRTIDSPGAIIKMNQDLKTADAFTEKAVDMATEKDAKTRTEGYDRLLYGMQNGLVKPGVTMEMSQNKDFMERVDKVADGDKSARQEFDDLSARMDKERGVYGEPYKAPGPYQEHRQSEPEVAHDLHEVQEWVKSSQEKPDKPYADSYPKLAEAVNKAEVTLSVPDNQLMSAVSKDNAVKDANLKHEVLMAAADHTKDVGGFKAAMKDAESVGFDSDNAFKGVDMAQSLRDDIQKGLNAAKESDARKDDPVLSSASRESMHVKSSSEAVPAMAMENPESSRELPKGYGQNTSQAGDTGRSLPGNSGLDKADAGLDFGNGMSR